MKTITMMELRKHPGEYAHLVSYHRESFVVTSNGAPAFRLVPVGDEQGRVVLQADAEQVLREALIEAHKAMWSVGWQGHPLMAKIDAALALKEPSALEAKVAALRTALERARKTIVSGYGTTSTLAAINAALGEG